MTSTSYEAVHTAISALCEDSFFYVHLEPTNACNTSCVMCPRDAMVRQMSMMDVAVLQRVVQVLLPPQVPMVSIVGFGEPTLHPRLVEMIAYIRAHRPDVIVKMTTNGSRLTPDFIERLYAAGLDLLEISAVGTTPEAYARAMGGLAQSTMLAALEHLNRRDHRYLLATFALDGAGPEQLRSYWTGQGARHVEVKALHRRGGYLRGPVGSPTPALGGYQGRGPLSLGATPASGLPVNACHKLYMFLHVNAHGNLVPCVQEINNKNVLANVSELDTFEDVVRLLRSHRPVFDICRGCELRELDQIDYYARFMLSYFPERVERLVGSARPVAGAGIL